MSEDIVARLRRAEWYCNASEEHMGYCNKKCAKRNLANPDECHAAADEIERLRAERDEARQMYCEEAFAHRFNERGGLGPITDPKQIAQGMKWDCFKENTDD